MPLTSMDSFSLTIYPVRNNSPLLCPVHHAVQGSAAGLDFTIILAGFNPLEFLTGFAVFCKIRQGMATYKSDFEGRL
jgi:hypothetical protein